MRELGSQPLDPFPSTALRFCSPGLLRCGTDRFARIDARLRPDVRPAEPSCTCVRPRAVVRRHPSSWGCLASPRSARGRLARRLAPARTAVKLFLPNVAVFSSLVRPLCFRDSLPSAARKPFALVQGSHLRKRWRGSEGFPRLPQKRPRKGPDVPQKESPVGPKLRFLAGNPAFPRIVVLMRASARTSRLPPHSLC